MVVAISSAYPSRQRRRIGDFLGLVSVAAILILIAVTYMRYPISASTLVEYFESMGRQGVLIKPPSILLDASIFFFYAAGGWGIVLSGLRIVFERSINKASSDLIGAFFSIFLAL